jgi:chromosome segregation ATPase
MPSKQRNDNNNSNGKLQWAEIHSLQARLQEEKDLLKEISAKLDNLLLAYTETKTQVQMLNDNNTKNTNELEKTKIEVAKVQQAVKGWYLFISMFVGLISSLLVPLFRMLLGH